MDNYFHFNQNKLLLNVLKYGFLRLNVYGSCYILKWIVIFANGEIAMENKKSFIHDKLIFSVF